jgi:hypothetical protein
LPDENRLNACFFEDVELNVADVVQQELKVISLDVAQDFICGSDLSIRTWVQREGRPAERLPHRSSFAPRPGCPMVVVNLQATRLRLRIS